MKIKEFIEKVNEYDGMWAKKFDKVIIIGTLNNNGILSIPEDATNFIEIDIWATGDSLCWRKLDRKKADREYLSALIEELLHTPVKERFPENKYRLRWIDSKSSGLYSFPCYLFISSNSSNSWNTADNDSCGKAIFTDSELNKLKHDNPRLASAIDAMKEKVKDDEE